MIPSLLTQTIIAFQDSTLASVIGVREMVRMTAIINARQVRPIWLYTMLAVIYLVLCIALSFLVRKIEKKTYEQLNV
jgi:glutamate/aspartate transport system permease protein